MQSLRQYSLIKQFYVKLHQKRSKAINIGPCCPYVCYCRSKFTIPQFSFGVFQSNEFYYSSQERPKWWRERSHRFVEISFELLNKRECVSPFTTVPLKRSWARPRILLFLHQLCCRPAPPRCPEAAWSCPDGTNICNNLWE